MGNFSTINQERLLRSASARAEIQERFDVAATRIKAIADGFAATVEQINGNEDLSAQGKRRKINDLRVLVGIDLRKAEAEFSFTNEIEKLRGETAPKPIKDPIEKMTQILADQEIRRHFQGIPDPLQAEAAFRTAISGPRGADIIRAVQGAPFALPIPPEVIDECATIVERLENPVRVAEINELVDANGLIQNAIKTARQEIGPSLHDDLVTLSAGSAGGE